MPAYGSTEFDTWMDGWTQYTQRLVDGGHFVSGASLQPTATATTLRRSSGPTQIVDGPFMETKEQLGGFYIIAVADLDEALALAEAMPVAQGSVEVRPIAVRPGA